MSALARILLQRGKSVAGSDHVSSLVTQELEKQGAQIFIGHQESHVQDAPTVIYSTAVVSSNPEISKARSEGLTCLHRSELLAELMEGYAALLIAGTHGKTTTSSLLAHVLAFLNLDPGYAIGGIVCSLGNNGRHGKGDYFVAEADESDGSFLAYYPFGAIITNIDNDHMDYWKTKEALNEGFSLFLQIKWFPMTISFGVEMMWNFGTYIYLVFPMVFETIMILLSPVIGKRDGKMFLM